MTAPRLSRSPTLKVLAPSAMNPPPSGGSMRVMPVFRLLAFLLIIAPLLEATPARAGEKERVFTVRGIVRGPLQNGTLRIAHQAIPGYMPAMTMPFNVDPSAEADAAQLRPGDGIEFKFAVAKTSRAYDFRRIGPNRAADDAAPAAAAPMRRLKEGAPVPPFALRDQLDRPVTAADLHGQRTVLTFIFTRCPVPEFCPLMSQRFKALQQHLAKQPPDGAPVQLLSITIDPEFDTPQILRPYAESYEADPKRWRFATGTTEQITALTKAFAVHTEKNAGTLDHTLATALIDSAGRVHTIWRGNGWTVNEVLAALASVPGGGASVHGEPPVTE